MHADLRHLIPQTVHLWQLWKQVLKVSSLFYHNLFHSIVNGSYEFCLSYIILFSSDLVEWEELFLENQGTKFRVHKKMSSRIGVLRIFPGITSEAVSIAVLVSLHSRAKRTQFVAVDKMGKRTLIMLVSLSLYNMI